MRHVSSSAASMMIHVGHHLDPGLYHLGTSSEGAPVRTEHCWVNILHMAPQGIPPEQGLFADDSVMLSEGNDADIDLCLMTKCDYHIIANSSFSWWGAWLGDSEKVVAPSNWFADSCAGKSVKDMEFSDWTWV